MEKPTKKEINKALKDAVKINVLEKKNGKYKYSKDFLKEAQKIKSKTTEEGLLELLWKFGYFGKAKTEKEIFVMCELLLLKKSKEKNK